MSIGIPRFLISACSSSSGKTTVTMALLSALKMKGFKVQSYKCGPDYIDPMYHSRITGVPAYHTDPFFMNGADMCRFISEKSEKADISVIEGAMGFYDGTEMSSDHSSYTVARETDTPVILVLDPKGMGCSAGAVCSGFVDYRTDNNIFGVILNNIRPKMYDYYRTIIEGNTGLKVYGYMPEISEFHLESRHLGLLTANEIKDLDEMAEKLGNIAAETLDIDGIFKLALSAGKLPFTENRSSRKNNVKVRLGVAMDPAFCFYYEENLELLREKGADIVSFSPLNDSSIPDDIDGIYLGGGYPELYADKLSSNHSFIASLHKKIDDGIPVFAECGGFLYLLEEMRSKDGCTYKMASVLKGSSHMKDHLVRFGYISLSADEDTLLLDKGDVIKAHEFHYFDTDSNGSSVTASKNEKQSWKTFCCYDNIMAGFPHLYFPSNPSAAEKFTGAMAEYRKKRGETV